MLFFSANCLHGWLIKHDNVVKIKSGFRTTVLHKMGTRSGSALFKLNFMVVIPRLN